MKIAMIGQKGIPARYGGVERIVEQLSLALAKRGHDLLVYTRPYYTPKEQTRFHNVRLKSLPTIPSKHLDTITHTFLSTIHVLTQKADIIHYHSVGPALLAWIPRLFSPRTKIVIDFQSQDKFHQKWGWFARMMLALGERAAMAFGHAATVPSKMLQQYAEKEFGKKPYLVPNGVPEAKNLGAKNIRKQFQLEPGQYFVLVSRLVRHKGIHYAIEAYQKLDTKLKLVIVGDTVHTDDYVQELRELAGNNPNIIFTGWQSGKMLQELIGNAYLYIQPSESEGMSLSLLEAAGYGVPLLVSDIPENLHIFSVPVLHFRSASTQDLHEKMKYSLTQPEKMQQLATQTRNDVIRKYRWETIAQTVETIYKGIKKSKHIAT